jgi:hypothetical protein
MEGHPVDIDIDPEQVVRWLMVEWQKGGSGLDVRVSRTNERVPVEPRAEDRLGDEEREDLSDEVTVAKLEVTPTHAGKGWRLVVSAEAELEPFVPDEDFEEKEQAPIDLDTFYLEFVRPGRAAITISAEAETVEAEADLVRLTNAIETNVHVPERRQLDEEEKVALSSLQQLT